MITITGWLHNVTPSKKSKNDSVPLNKSDDGPTTATPVKSKKGFVRNDGIDDTAAITVHTPRLYYGCTRESGRELLKWYGNTISLIDATYKATRYDLALFFVCIRTNVGYSVVAEIVVQSENAENVQEALMVLKQWNKDRNPQ